MKTKLIILSLFAATLTGQGGEIDYRTTLKRAHVRLNSLETERREYRKTRPELLPELEKERLQLIGQLTELDPLWILSRNLEADIETLALAPDRSEADTQTLERLKELLAIISGVVDLPASQDQALKYSTALRAFIVRRDVTGAIAWAKER
jgi:septum formation topological specificity factor MinE